MLVTFTCKAYADITMFGDVAKTLLKLMGHSGTVPGAILAKDVPDALDRLKTGVAQSKLDVLDPAEPSRPRNPGEQPVSLSHRAYPLVQLLAAAAKAKCDVMWNS